MRQGKQYQKRIVGVLLALALVLGSLTGLVPGTQMTAKAAVEKKFNLGDRVTIDEVAGREWYVVKQDSTSVTLLSTKCFKECRFGVTSNYASSMVKKELRSLMSGELASIKSVLCEEPRLLTANEVEHIRPRRKSILKCGHDHYWWTQTPSGAKNQHVRNITVRCVQGAFAWIQSGEAGKPTMSTYGMRPAIKLDLSKVSYDDERKAFFIIPDHPDPVEAPKAVIRKYPTESYGLVENGQLQDLLSRDGEVENGEMVYTLTTDEPTLEELDNLPDTAWSTDFPQGIEPKTYYVCFKARGTRDDVSYYDDSPAEFFIVKIIPIEEAEKATVTKWPEAKIGMIANGQAQELVEAGTAEHGEMRYALGTDSDTAPEAGAFSASIPKGTDAGTYYVWFKARANARYVDSEAACVVTEIIKPEEVEKEKKAEVIEEPKAKSKLIPNGQPQELVTPGTGTQGIMVYALGQDAITVPPEKAFSEFIPKVTEPGRYYVWFKQKGDEGFVDTDPVCVTVVIRGSAVAPAPTAKSLTYSGYAQELVTAGKVTGGTMYYALGTATEATEPYTTSIPKGTDVGTYYVWYKTVGDSDHLDSGAACVTVTITEEVKPAKEVPTITQGSINTEVKQEENTPKSEVEGLDTELAESVMTEKEKQMVNSGEKSILSLEMKNIDNSVSQEDKSLINDFLKKQGGNTAVGMYIDMSLWLRIGASYSRQLTSTGGKPLRVKMSIPSYLHAPADIRRTFFLIKIQGGVASKIGQSTTTDMEVQIGESSTYVLAYEDEEIVKSSFNTSIKIKQTDNSLKISWDKAKNVTKVEVYITYCGSDYPSKAVKTTKGNSVTIKKINGKKLNLKKDFELYLVGYNKDGKKIGKTPSAHFAGKKSEKYTNPKSIKLSKTKVSITKGKKTKVKASIKLEDKKRKQLPKEHAAKLRYRSTNTNVATVDKNGNIKGISAGSCTVYVYAMNGLSKKVSVTVKE